MTATSPPVVLPREYLEIDGLRLAYRDRGAAEGRPPVVLLHGWGGSIDAVAGIQAGLEREFRVVAFDLPGFGASSPPPSPWGSPEYAALLLRALDRLTLERVSLIGHSFGGKIALQLAARQPQRVARLVLVSSAGIRPRRSPLQLARMGAFKAARRLAGQGALSDWLARRFGSADYRSAGPLRATLVRVVNEDLRPLLARVSAPTLLIWGERDTETPLADGVIMEREIPDAGLVVFPGAGHFPYLDDLPRFCRVAGSFLKG